MKQTQAFLKSYFLLIFFLQIIWTDTSIFFFFHYLLLVCNQVYMIKVLFFQLLLLLIAFYNPVVLFMKFINIHKGSSNNETISHKITVKRQSAETYIHVHMKE